MRFLTGLLFISLWCSNSFATIIYVPQDQPTIQEGINAAVDGDTVLVDNGHYYERISFLGKGIVVASHFILEEDTLHIANTIIDGDTSVIGYPPDSSNVVRFVNGEDSASQLVGFIIQNGIGTPLMNFPSAGGGVFCQEYSTSPQVKHCWFRWNYAHTGAAAWVTGYFYDCRFFENTAAVSLWHGGAVGCRNGLMEDCSFTENYCAGLITGYGGEYRNCYFSGNSSHSLVVPFGTKEGYDHSRKVGVVFEFCVFDNDGISTLEGMSLHLQDCTFRNSTTTPLRIGNYEAGINFSASGCQFIHNAGTDGGAIYCNSGWLGNITNCLFADNVAERGGAIFTGATKGDSRVAGVVRNCTFVNNSANQGAAISSPWGYYQTERLIIENSIFAFNRGAKAIDCGPDPAGVPIITCTNIFGNPDGDWVDCIGDQAGSAGNFSANPMFCDTSEGDFSIHTDSPCAPDGNSCGVLIGALGVSCTGPAISDAIHILNYIFSGGPAPEPYESGDVDCNGIVTVSDAVLIINHIFAGTEPPCDPTEL